MTRILPAALLLAPLAACAADTPQASPAAPAAPAQRPPNIVYILADDLGWGEVGCYGQRKIRTPNLDGLAQEGLRFTRAYTGAPVCAPSRAVLMTGRSLANCPIRGNLDPDPKTEGQTPLPPGVPTLAGQLKSAGYATAAIGKWGIGAFGNSGDPHACGFEHFFGIIDQRLAHSSYPDHLWNDGKQVPLDNGAGGVPGHGKLAGADGDFAKFQGRNHATGRLMADLDRWLGERAKDPRPFFLYLPFAEPHLALQPPQRWVEAYPPEWDPAPYLGDKGYVPHPRPRAAYAGMISYLDENVGKVLAKLKELKLDGDTLVIFTSDNGPTHNVGGVDTHFFQSAGPWRGRKGSCYEGGIRVPFIVRWPGRTAAGTTSAEMVAASDMMATLCDIAGAKTPPTDGVSVRPLFEGRPLPAAHPPLAWDFPEYGGQQALHLGEWKIVRGDLQKKASDWQLYHLAEDPGEKTDLAAQEPARVLEMVAEFNRRRTPNPLFRIQSVDGPKAGAAKE